MPADEPLLSIRNLSVDLGESARKRTRILHDIDLDLYRGEVVALVGESGSGKSTLGRSVLGLIDSQAGIIMYKGENVTRSRTRSSLKARETMRVVFQDPYSSLNPSRTVEYSVAQGLPHHGRAERQLVRDRVRQALRDVGLPEGTAERYPAQFSGGQRQRIAIARALISEPDLVVCDEPVTALDLSVQAQILNLLMDIRERTNLTYLFVAHSIPVVRFLADRVVVLNKGRIVEQGLTAQIVNAPRDHYTRALINAAPVPDPVEQKRRRELRLATTTPSTPEQITELQ